MMLLVAPLLFVAAVIFVVYPLLGETKEEILEDPVATQRDRLGQEKEELIANLKDIEMDYQMGKLSETDYAALKADFEHRAVAVLQQLDELNGRQRPKSS